MEKQISKKEIENVYKNKSPTKYMPINEKLDNNLH